MRATTSPVARRLAPVAMRPPMRPPLQTQLEWIAALPASREAERLLALPAVGVTGRDPTLPALLTLLQWALEEAPGVEQSIDRSEAREAWEALMQLDLRGEPAAAVLALLPCRDPECEVPAELLADSADAAAVGILALAASAFPRRTRSGRQQ